MRAVVGLSGPVPARVEVALTRQAEDPLLDRLALPRRLFERHGIRSLVVFDEFQDVLSTTSNADAVIRSEIQHHATAASYVFAGSHLGMISSLFGDRRRAFYGQAGRVELGPLQAGDVAEFVAARFAETDRDPGAALPALLDLAAGHPQRTMLLANALWSATAAGTTATETTWVTALDRVRASLIDEHRAIWTSLPTGQRRVLVAVASDAETLNASTKNHGASRGGALRQAVDSLVARGELVVDPTQRTGHRVVDPMLAAWVNDGRPESGLTLG